MKEAENESYSQLKRTIQRVLSDPISLPIARKRKVGLIWVCQSKPPSIQIIKINNTILIMIQSQQKQTKLVSFWSDQQLRNYNLHQIEEAGLDVCSVSAVYVYLKMYVHTVNEKKEKEKVKIIIALGRGFPISPPLVFIADSFITPSLKDYRDVLVELIGQSWNCQLHNLKKIASRLPVFIDQLTVFKGNSSAMQKIGQYEMNRYYEYETLKQLSEHQPFISFEHEEEQIHFYVISITACHFLLFKPVKQPYFDEHKLVVPKQKQIGLLNLLFVAEIQSLYELDHTRSKRNEYKLSFLTVQIKKMEYSKRIWTKSLKITRSNQFVECLIKSVKHYNIDISLEIGSLKRNSQEEELIIQMAQKEQKLKHYFNKNTIFEVNQVYQKLVEFYSSIGLPYHQIYVHKIANLYNREDVKLIMKAESIVINR